MKLAYPAIITKDNDGFFVEFPDLPGCFTDGDSLADALYNAQEASSGWLLSALEDGDKLPEVTDMSLIEHDDNTIISMIVVDMDETALKYGKHSVKKTLTIPAWMNTFTEEHNISCSKLLREAIEGVISQQVS